MALTQRKIDFHEDDVNCSALRLSVYERLAARALIAYAEGWEWPNTTSSCEAGRLSPQSQRLGINLGIKMYVRVRSVDDGKRAAVSVELFNAYSGIRPEDIARLVTEARQCLILWR